MLIILFFILTIALMSSIKANTGIALIFGIAAGCLGALDNIFKRISLREGLTGFLQWQNILIFIFSAILVIIAIILTQVGFFKGNSTSKQISAYNSFYIIMPIVIELIIFENSSISIFKIISIIIVILGIVSLSSAGIKNIEKSEERITDTSMNKILNRLLSLHLYIKASVVIKTDGTILASAISSKISDSLYATIVMNFSMIGTEIMDGLNAGAMKSISVKGGSGVINLAPIDREIRV